MTEVLARIVLCVLHDRPEVVREICVEFAGFEYDETYSGQGPDDRMSKSFDASECTVQPSLTVLDRAAIAEHRDVAYILSPRIRADSALGIAALSLRLVKRLLDAGAQAVKCESSGLAHGGERWRELADRDDAAALYWAWVRRPLSDDGVVYSCGLHLLGLSDVEVVGGSARDAVELIDGFGMYLLVDKPGDQLQAGHTFSPYPNTPAFRLTKTRCERYEDDDFFYNPSGYWRLKATGMSIH